MPRIQLEFKPVKGIDLEGDFKSRYGGSQLNWNFVQEEIRRVDPVLLRARCESLVACDRLTLPPVWIFGRLDIQDESAWLDGLHKGVFWMDAVVHEDYAAAYYEERLEKVPQKEQEL